MILASMDILVSYSSIVIADTSLDRMFNDWSDAHVRQGFSWRQGSVSFGTFDSIDMLLEVQIVADWKPRDDALRIIQVPFAVNGSGTLLIDSLGMEHYVSVPVGEYCLIYEHGLLRGPGVGKVKSDEKLWGLLTFIPGDIPEPKIVLADEELDPPNPLVMTAEPI
ncbi:MAG: hypothetical protein FLDDKLPJ_03630 [Phycisphaerae bacterium]|nr:hypothetical protein [Phycisphaerae bacterium]